MGLEQHESVKIMAELAFFLVNCTFKKITWILHTELWTSPKSFALRSFESTCREDLCPALTR